MKIVTIKNGDFNATIDLDMLPKLPLFKIRKLFCLLLSESRRNAETIPITEKWLSEAVIKAKSERCLTGTKKAKGDLERMSKIQIAFQEIKNKEKRNYVY